MTYYLVIYHAWLPLCTVRISSSSHASGLNTSYDLECI